MLSEKKGKLIAARNNRRFTFGRCGAMVVGGGIYIFRNKLFRWIYILMQMRWAPLLRRTRHTLPAFYSNSFLFGQVSG